MSITEKKILNLLKDVCRDLTLLIAEDENHCKERFKAFVEPFFKSVDAVEDGQKAFELYKQKRHDIVLTDIYMPNMDGIVLCKKIKELNSSQAILAMSAYPDVETLIFLININVNGFFLKSAELFSSGGLVESIYKTALKIQDSKLQIKHEEILLDQYEKLYKQNQELKKSLAKLGQTKEEEPKKESIRNEIREKIAQTEEILKTKSKISALEFMRTFEGDFDEFVDELSHALGDLEIGINNISKDIGFVHKVAFELLHISELLNKTDEFSAIANALESLASKMRSLDEIPNKNAQTLLFTVIDNLKNWIDVIFVSKTAIDIHYLDASFINDIAFIESLIITKKESALEVVSGEDDDFILF